MNLTRSNTSKQSKPKYYLNCEDAYKRRIIETIWSEPKTNITRLYRATHNRLNSKLIYRYLSGLKTEGIIFFIDENENLKDKIDRQTTFIMSSDYKKAERYGIFVDNVHFFKPVGPKFKVCEHCGGTGYVK